jgi:glutaredoxin
MPAKKFVVPIVSLALAFAFAVQAQTNVYRWVDKDGKVHFSDTPPNTQEKDVTQKRVGGGYAEDSPLPYATQVAAKKNPVTMYVATDCGNACTRARDLLLKRGIPFTEKNAQTNATDADTLKKLAGTPEVPFLLIGESKIKGYEEDTWNSALDTAGYPRTRLPGPQAAAPAPAPAANAPQGSTAPAK